ncbi:DUF300 domain protein [Emericellopsis cladophorae]|uniref:DUF300 domain protein n=1 Tax=Emericellopsis cladophorae TaxID=2686198 RepID=A0A9P9XZ98_9HYPO|nr:DUF300 domain protein [Emericellopsis cladophorae]KAI6780658.1 DUF300 domain protein [Emericellopsis cladophorae]
MPQLEPYKGDYYLWKYLPNLPVCIVFGVLFILITTAHIWRMVKARLWFCSPFIFGGIVMVLGFLMRGIAYYNTSSLVLFILQSTFLVLPPAFFAASMYMVYTRIVRALGREDCSIIPSRWSTRLFLAADILCINIQGNGAGLTANQTPAVATAGRWVLISGLILHVVVFTGFIYICASFHRRFRQYLVNTGETTLVPWRQTLTMLYCTSVTIMARNIFRTIEYVMGQDAYLLTNEWPLYVFDFGPMAVLMLAFLIWYPGNIHGSGREAMELHSRDSAGEPFARGKTSERS